MARTRFRLGARSLALATGLALVASPLGGVARADNSTLTLGVRDEVKNTRVGENRPMYASLSAPPDAGTTVNIDFEITGPSDPDGGNTPQSPDLSCSIDAGTIDDPATNALDESHECRVGYKGDTAGEDLTRAWIDADGSDGTVEADMGEDPADKDGDNTDVVSTLWFDGVSGSTRLNCDPEVVKTSVGSTAVVVDCLLVRTSDNTGVAGVLIDGENLGGANDTTHVRAFPSDYRDLCTTDAGGRCRIALPAGSATEAGTADICFWADEDADEGYHATAAFDGAECDEPTTDSAANLNTTDVVRFEWRHDRSLAWNAVAAPTYGRRFSLSGRLGSAVEDCRAGVRVTIERTLLDGTESVVGSATTDANGAYSLNRIPARKSARYTASVDQTAACNEKVSGAKLVKVRKRVALRLRRTRVEKGQRVRIRASFAPCGRNAGQRITLWASTNNGRSFRKVATKRTGSNCGALFRPRVRRATRFRATSGPNGDYLGGVSAVKQVRIR